MTLSHTVFTPSPWDTSLRDSAKGAAQAETQTTMTDYESLRRQCRTLESLLDVKLTSYSRLAANIGRGPTETGSSTSGERWQDLEEEIDGLLEKVCSLLLLSRRRRLMLTFSCVISYKRQTANCQIS